MSDEKVKQLETNVPTQQMMRFVFIHRINVSGIPVKDIPEFMEGVRANLAGADKMPMIEYFVPVRSDEDYSLTIVDLANNLRSEKV
jgi:hypothetical protein